MGTHRPAGPRRPSQLAALSGRPAQVSASTTLWQKVQNSLNEFVKEARHDPHAAQQLFNLLTMYSRDHEIVVHQVRPDSEQLGLPADFGHISYRRSCLHDVEYVTG